MSAPSGANAVISPEPNYLGDLESWRNDMRATIRLDGSLDSRAFDHRDSPRMTISLPIFIVLDGTRHNAILRNLSTGGAMIVTSAPLVLHMKMEFHCGLICASGTVVWQRRIGSGIRFENRLCELKLKEQVSRLIALGTGG